MSANMPTHIRTAAAATEAASKKQRQQQQQQRHIRTAQRRPFEPQNNTSFASCILHTTTYTA